MSKPTFRVIDRPPEMKAQNRVDRVQEHDPMVAAVLGTAGTPRAVLVTADKLDRRVYRDSIESLCRSAAYRRGLKLHMRECPDGWVLWTTRPE